MVDLANIKVSMAKLAPAKKVGDWHCQKCNDRDFVRHRGQRRCKECGYKNL